MKRKYEFKNIVAETLLIPLYMRAKESRRKDAILKDKMAEQLIACIEYDYSNFDGAKLSEVGCVVRGRYFDDAVRRFIDNHSRPIVVNVGCGLDTRCQRIHRENDPKILRTGFTRSNLFETRIDSRTGIRYLYIFFFIRNKMVRVFENTTPRL